jgi:hypothetical protein
MTITPDRTMRLDAPRQRKLRMPACHRWPHASGQSTLEFIVLTLVLVPLLLIVPLLGKQLDVAHAAINASRYLAFEGMVHHGAGVHAWKTDATLAAEIGRRFFSNSNAPIKTGDLAGDFDAHRNPLWFDPRGRALLPALATNVGAATRREALAQPFGALHADNLGLDGNSLYTGRVRVDLAKIDKLVPFDTLELSIQRQTTVLVDAWAASGPDGVRSALRRDGWNPLGPFPYRPLHTLVAPLKPFVAVLEGANPPDIGRVDPDIIPAERIR